MSVSITFLGGAGTVTGSKYLVRHGRHTLLVDCGLFQGYKQLRLRNWNPLPVAPNQIDAVLLTHDPKFDDPTLMTLLRTSCRYIGAIGSRNTTIERNERLRAAGFTDDDIARIHSPIGLDLGSVTPEEVALSIVAEMIAVRYGRDGRKLSDKLRAALAAEDVRA